MSGREFAVWTLVAMVAAWCVAVGLATRAESGGLPHPAPTELYTVTEP